MSSRPRPVAEPARGPLPAGGLASASLGTRAACAAILVCAAAVRLAPCFDDFWLDEIWTYFTARKLASGVEVFTGVGHSNNHHLNTLLVYWIGERESWVAYRLPSWLAGVATVALAAALAGRRGRAEAVFASLLTGASFALIQFSSEARGYALAVFFALLACEALERFLARPRAASALLFGASVLLGVLSQLVFLFFYAGAWAQSAWRCLVRGPGGRRAVLRLAALHALPCAGCLLLYAVDLRHMTVGLGPPPDPAALVARVFGFALGLPVLPALAPVYAAGGALVLGLGLWLRWRERDDSALLFAVCIALAPAAALAWLRPAVVEVRYFLIGIAFFLLLASDLLARLYRRGPRGRAASLALTCAFLLGNARHTADFLRLGRGGYAAAARLMAERTAGPRITVGSDQDLRNGMALRFYQRVLPAGKRLAYFRRGRWPDGGPEWVISHRLERPPATPARIFDDAGNAYALTAEFDRAGLSGFWWGVYRNEDPRARARAALEPGG